MKRIGIISIGLLLCLAIMLWATDRPGFKNGNVIGYRADFDSVFVQGEKVATQAEMYDSLALKGPYYYTGIAGDTTSPGKFYTINTDGKWTRADTSISTVAIAVAMDSVFIDSTCRFQYSGVFILEAWSGNWTYGDRIFSDSARAGEVGRGGQAAPKKMQSYGVAIDSTSILLNIDHTIAY